MKALTKEQRESKINFERVKEVYDFQFSEAKRVRKELESAQDRLEELVSEKNGLEQALHEVQDWAEQYDELVEMVRDVQRGVRSLDELHAMAGVP
jgi:DNA repair exonuclease SbcCD ATPase subunit